MRERPVEGQYPIVTRGITPAHAGKTPSRRRQRAVEGSPPRMRERRLFNPRFNSRFGITPAHAGKTLSGKLTSSWNEDHPRACGKDQGSVCQRLPRWGSPPRVRERLVGNAVVAGLGGITPACAGKTYLFSACAQDGKDHPRVCGKDKRRTIK